MSTRSPIRNGADNKWDLLFYEPKTFYDPAFKTWEIKSRRPRCGAQEPDKNFMLKSEGKKLTASSAHGSTGAQADQGEPAHRYRVRERRAKFEILALPLAGATFKDTTIGVATGVQEG